MANDLNRRAVIGSAVALAVVAAAALILSMRAPPQIGNSPEVFKTVDALYTAVRNEDAARMAECETRLNEYRTAKKLSPKAADKLSSIIAKAKAGAWQTAAERLYDFMIGQRRDTP